MDTKKQMFDDCLQSMEVAGLAADGGDAILCPLCWRETAYPDLTLEHVVPKSVGGGNLHVLSCTWCNNQQGSTLDSHLERYQRTRDTFHGFGKFRGKLVHRGQQVSADVEWGDGYKNFSIVGKASNPHVVAAMMEDSRVGNVGQFDLTLFYGYSRNGFRTALVRSAYLALFKSFGYEYLRHELVQVIRRRIGAPTAEFPRLESLVGELRGTIRLSDPLVIGRGDLNGVQLFIVIIQLRKSTMTHHFVFMPVPMDGCDEFYSAMDQFSQENPSGRLRIPYMLSAATTCPIRNGVPS